MFNLEYIRHAKRFYAVQLPLYYYVKTKGSLVSQGMSISKTVKMKLMVFEYYNSFYKEVLSDEDYEQKRLMVYRFLIDSANDGIVLPSLVPSTKKLGEERCSANQKLLQDTGILSDFYCTRKLRDYYLEPVAIRNELELNDVKVLWGLKQIRTANATSDLADSIGMHSHLYSAIIQKLAQKKLLKIEKTRNPKQVTISLFEDTESILTELEVAEKNYQKALFSNFTKEEIDKYNELSNKIKNTIQSIL